MSGFTGSPAPNGGSDGLNALLNNLRRSSNKPVADGSIASPSGGESFLAQLMSQQGSQYLTPGHSAHGSQDYRQATGASVAQASPAETQLPQSLPALRSPAPDASLQRGLAENTSRKSSANQTNANNLLSLLNFSPSIGASTTPVKKTTQPESSPIVGRKQDVAPAHAQIDSGLLSVLTGSSTSKAEKSSFQPDSKPDESSVLDTLNTQATSSSPVKEPSGETQAYLIKLLSRPKPAQTVEDTPQELVNSEILHTVPKQKDVEQAPNTPKGTSSGNKEGGQLGQVVPKFTYVNPFEQLAESSPRNRTPKPTTPSQHDKNSAPMHILKPPPRTASGTSNQVPKSGRGHNTVGVEQSKTNFATVAVSNTPSPLADGRSPLEALMGIGASGKDRESVAEPLTEVRDQDDKEVEQALARANSDETQIVIEDNLRKMLNARADAEFEIRAQTAAAHIQKELEKKGNENVLEDHLPSPVAEAVKTIIDKSAEGNIADSWENVDEENARQERESSITVYNFPLKPFVAITINADFQFERPNFNQEVIDIARLKKDFDQIDRTLATATNNYIVYCMSKNGGIRIIRQEDGKDGKIFVGSQDRVITVACSSSPTSSQETVMGTGISGTVYWAAIRGPDGDYLGEDFPEQHGFSLPPIQPAGDELTGGVLKTRARKSCRHPEFFAVGRGKTIQIIWPSIIMKQGYLKQGKERVVDTAKYLSHRSLQINTGKAGKDFTFSPDDTTIVSLDKAGRVKFWDVRTLTNTNRDDEGRFPAPEQIQPIEIKDPLMTLNTTFGNEKSWPTSVQLIDKTRPYLKGGALRYLLVGMKQNHTLQLWDIALSRPVQEIHLPHKAESDAICSVVYHPASNMIIVGHPTRNSIYFIHLSAPKYNLSKAVNQAEYIDKLMKKDKAIPKPDATAVMSGIREYSLGNKGELRSLDIIQDMSEANRDDSTLFELYAMHSKGVLCLPITLAHLGLNQNSRVARPVLAEEVGFVTIKPLQPPPEEAVLESSASTLSDRNVPARVLSHEIGRKTATPNGITDRSRPGSKALKTESSPNNTGNASQDSSTEKEKKRKKPASILSEVTGQSPSSTSGSGSVGGTHVVETPSKTILARGGNGTLPFQSARAPQSASKNDEKSGLASASKKDSSFGDTSNLGIAGVVQKLETNLSSEVSRLINASNEQIYQRFDNDKRIQAASADAKYDSLLRLVSSTLTENVDKTLSKIIVSNIKEDVIPSLHGVVAKAINDQLGSKLNTQMKTAIPRELQTILPDVVGKTLQSPTIVNLMAETLAKSVTFKFEEQLTSILQGSVLPAFTRLASQTAQNVAADVHRQASEQLDKLQLQLNEDAVKIDQLCKLVTGSTEMLSSLASSQSKYQGEFLGLQQLSLRNHQQFAQDYKTFHSDHQKFNREYQLMTQEFQRTQEKLRALETVHEKSLAAIRAGHPEKSQQQIEFDDTLAAIKKAMDEGRTEEAIMKWLHSTHGQEAFNGLLVRYEPSFIRTFNSLMLLSISTTLCAQLNGAYLIERLNWLEHALLAFRTLVLDDEIRQITPRIMGEIGSHLETVFVAISAQNAQDPLLKRLSILITATNRIRDNARM